MLTQGRQGYFARPDETLLRHLVNTARMASAFAQSFGGASFAVICGYLHDLGKYSNSFQDYMRRVIQGEKAVRGETIHSLQGAVYAYENLKDVGIADIIVNIVASHHSELLDMLCENGRTSTVRLEKRTTRKGETLQDLYNQAINVPEAASLLQKIDEKALTSEMNTLMARIKEAGLGFFGIQMFVRMVYSCLVDADRCDAAGFDGHLVEPPWQEIGAALDVHMKGFSNDTPLNKVRDKISRQCLQAGTRGKGIYTLAVPTGGGKTLSSLRFAIRHAQHNHMKRIVYVIPYLSIIDQTAKELRTIFKDKSDEWMLEHHSDIVLETANEDENDEKRVLTERWDRPIIVTTMVRFMETIFSNRSSDLRKLHNMTETVFVFDEIQALPIRCIYLFNMAVNFLCQIGGSSAVLCTATQPALTEDKVERKIHLSGNPALVSLTEGEKELFKRVEYKTTEPMTTEEIAAFACDFLKERKSVLVVLNTKKTALSVYRSCTVPKDCVKLYLTTDLCAQHRKDNIEFARRNMKSEERKPILCVSTQLIEAGVDFSFDVVIRANAGLDNIIQAAGRCNRNGEHDTRQRTYIVEVKDEDLTHLQEIVSAKEATRRTLKDFPEAELTEPCVLDRFYAYSYGTQQGKMCYLVKEGHGKGKHETIYGILDKNESTRSHYRQLYQEEYKGCCAAFATAAKGFHMIEGSQIATVVPYAPCYEKILELVGEFKKVFEPKERMKILRKLQPYTVSLYAYRESWLQTNAEKVCDVFYLVGEGRYDPEIGLTEENGFLNC